MRSRPALSPRDLVGLTVAGQPPRDSTQRRMRSWFVVRLAAALTAGFFVLFVDAARFFVDAAVFLECGRPARAGRASRPSAFAVRRRAGRAADAAETAALRFFVFVFVARFRSTSFEKR